MPQQERTDTEIPAFDVRAVSTIASISESRLEVRGSVFRKDCKCAGTSSTGHVEKASNANGGVSLSYDFRLCCDVCGKPWLSAEKPGG